MRTVSIRPTALERALNRLIADYIAAGRTRAQAWAKARRRLGRR